MTYDQALEMTLTRNPELKAASYEQEAALRERKAAYGLRLPQASVTGTYVYMGDDMSLGMNDLKMGRSAESSAVCRKDCFLRPFCSRPRLCWQRIGR